MVGSPQDYTAGRVISGVRSGSFSSLPAHKATGPSLQPIAATNSHGWLRRPPHTRWTMFTRHGSTRALGTGEKLWRGHKRGIGPKLRVWISPERPALSPVSMVTGAGGGDAATEGGGGEQRSAPQEELDVESSATLAIACPVYLHVEAPDTPSRSFRACFLAASAFGGRVYSVML